jgi:HEAT repeat protein
VLGDGVVYKIFRRQGIDMNDYLDLIARLSDENRVIRVQTARSLRELNASEAIPALTLCLKDENSDVQHAAAQALETISPR